MAKKASEIIQQLPPDASLEDVIAKVNALVEIVNATGGD